MNSDCPQHYALNASGKEEINLGSISASGPLADMPSPYANVDFESKRTNNVRLLSKSTLA